MAVEQILEKIKQSLEALSDTPALDAQVLLAHVLERNRAWVLAHPEAALTDVQEQRLHSAVSRLQAGEPLPYVLGRWEFFGRNFVITPAVLIPRPETELLVEQALAWLAAHPGTHWAADVGVGSGCIAVTLAVEMPALQLVASDISWEALQVARCNASQHQVMEQVHFVQADLLSPLHSQFELVCANLPYIPSALLKTLPVARSEPGLALDGGDDGLEALRRLLSDLPAKVKPGGLVLLEIEASQGEVIRALVQSIFPGSRVQILTDLAGQDRLCACLLPG